MAASPNCSSSTSRTSLAAARQRGPPGASYSAWTCVRNSAIAASFWSSVATSVVRVRMPSAELRVFLRDQNLDLTDTFLNNGFRSIPIVVFFDKDWNEVGRWLERAHAATAQVIPIRARTVDAAPKDDKAKQDAAMNDFRAQVNAEYAAPDNALWKGAIAEVRALLETKLGAKK